MHCDLDNIEESLAECLYLQCSVIEMEELLVLCWALDSGYDLSKFCSALQIILSIFSV